MRADGDRPIDDAVADAAIAEYTRTGVARLGPLLDEDELPRLRDRIDALMLGHVRHDGLFFQKDAASGRYEDLFFGRGWEGPALDYRKIEKIELDPLFRPVVDHPRIARVARRLTPDAPFFTLYRAVVWTKSAAGGCPLPWHQDDGDFWGIDRSPAFQVWIALDDAPLEGACLCVAPGTHAAGLVTPHGGRVPPEAVLAARADELAVAFPAAAGDALLLHPHAWHASGVNTTGRPRRALGVCYLDGRTRCTRKRRAPREFLRVLDALEGER